MRILVVDPGGRRLGFALAHDDTGVVTPLDVAPSRGIEAAAEMTAAAARRHQADLIVVGLPTAADGSEGPACRRSRNLVAALETRGLTVSLHPEHLTTREARERARAVGRRPSAPVDDLAAAIIAEDFLTAHAAGNEDRR